MQLDAGSLYLYAPQTVYESVEGNIDLLEKAICEIEKSLNERKINLYVYLKNPSVFIFFFFKQKTRFAYLVSRIVKISI